MKCARFTNFITVKIKGFTILMLLFLQFNLSYTQTLEVAGTLTQDTHWEVDTIILTDHVQVPDSVSLSIAAGTNVLAYEQKHLEVRGRLNALGSIANPILFSAYDTLGFSDTISPSGTWGGIHFLDLNEHRDSSILDYCIIEYGGAYGQEDIDKQGGGVYIDESSIIRISNSTLQHNFAEKSGGAVFIYENSSPLIRNNLIRDNVTFFEGGGIMSMENSFPLIEYNMIIRNRAFMLSWSGLSGSGAGGGVLINTLSDEGIAIVRSNLICNNHAGIGGGVYDSSWNSQVVSNIICNNRGNGIFSGHTASASSYVNNTIVNNRGEGVWLLTHHIKLVNNIIQGNYYHEGYNFVGRTDVSHPEDFSFQHFRHNNIGYVREVLGNGDGEAFDPTPALGNINQATQFAAPTPSYDFVYNGYNANWRLAAGDANIEAGTTEAILDMLPPKDAYGKTRILGETIDIGAVEYDRVSVVNEGLNTDEVRVYPNPFSAQVWIELEAFGGQAWQLSVWNELGQLVTNIDAAQSIRMLHTANWPAGMYTIEGRDRQGKRLFVKQLVKGE